MRRSVCSLQGHTMELYQFGALTKKKPSTGSRSRTERFAACCGILELNSSSFWGTKIRTVGFWPVFLQFWRTTNRWPSATRLTSDWSKIPSTVYFSSYLENPARQIQQIFIYWYLPVSPPGRGGGGAEKKFAKAQEGQEGWGGGGFEADVRGELDESGWDCSRGVKQVWAEGCRRSLIFAPDIRCDPDESIGEGVRLRNHLWWLYVPGQPPLILKTSCYSK